MTVDACMLPSRMPRGGSGATNMTAIGHFSNLAEFPTRVRNAHQGGRPLTPADLWVDARSVRGTNRGTTACCAAKLFPRLHPLEPHALAVGLPRRDVAAFEAGFALRHLLLRAALGLPPRGAMRRARQGGVDDLLDLLEAQHEFGKLLLLQIVPQQVVVVHRGLSGQVGLGQLSPGAVGGK